MDTAQRFDDTLKTALDQPSVGLNYEAVARWLPFSIEPVTLENFLGNASLYPQALPLTTRELYLYQAMTKEIFRKALAAKSFDFDQSVPVILPEEIARLSRNEKEAVLFFLDAVAPVGVVDLLDANQQKLATLFCFTTSGVNSKVAEVKIDSGLSQPQKLNLAFGDLILIPSEREERVELTINCAQKVKIGRATRVKVVATPGLVGLVFDCRGRPFAGPDLTAASRELVKRWQKAFGIEPTF